jgi:hypothetical protein
MTSKQIEKKIRTLEKQVCCILNPTIPVTGDIAFKGYAFQEAAGTGAANEEVAILTIPAADFAQVGQVAYVEYASSFLNSGARDMRPYFNSIQIPSPTMTNFDSKAGSVVFTRLSATEVMISSKFFNSGTFSGASSSLKYTISDATDITVKWRCLSGGNLLYRFLVSAIVFNP